MNTLKVKTNFGEKKLGSGLNLCQILIAAVISPFSSSPAYPRAGGQLSAGGTRPPHHPAARAHPLAPALSAAVHQSVRCALQPWSDVCVG